MDMVYISDFTKENRKELIILIFEAFYPHSKVEYNDNFIHSLLQNSKLIKQIYYDNAINVYDFDTEFGCGTFQDLVNCLRDTIPKKDIFEDFTNLSIK